MEESVVTGVKSEAKTEEAVRRLYRLPKAGKIAGVCAGLAQYLAIDVTLLRIVFVVLTLASGGFGILIYLILALMMPVSNHLPSDSAHGDFGNNINSLASQIRDSKGVTQVRNYIGVIIALFGVWLLLAQLFPKFISMNWTAIWPIMLIFLGGIIIFRRS